VCNVCFGLQPASLSAALPVEHIKQQHGGHTRPAVVSRNNRDNSSISRCSRRQVSSRFPSVCSALGSSLAFGCFNVSAWVLQFLGTRRFWSSLSLFLWLLCIWLLAGLCLGSASSWYLAVLTLSAWFAAKAESFSFLKRGGSCLCLLSKGPQLTWQTRLFMDPLPLTSYSLLPASLLPASLEQSLSSRYLVPAASSSTATSLITLLGTSS